VSSPPDAHEDDVPSPIDLRDEADAAAWVAAADVTRPWRAEVRAAIAELLRAGSPPPLRILELGPGPGLLAEVVLGACQVESYTLLDFSAPMLARCRQRLGGHPAVHVVLDDFTRPGWTGAVAPPFDAVLAMQAVHEVRHKRHVPRLYAQIAPVLRPGGRLIVCDHTPLDNDRHRALHATEQEQHAALAAAGLGDVTTHLTLHGLYLCSGRAPVGTG
jgi:SAM-dependent methyltransferase